MNENEDMEKAVDEVIEFAQMSMADDFRNAYQSLENDVASFDAYTALLDSTDIPPEIQHARTLLIKLIAMFKQMEKNALSVGVDFTVWHVALAVIDKVDMP